MFSKIAFKNVTKSIRDYAVYFLTLTFGVCLFYAFNSLDSQSAMLALTESKRELLQSISQLIGYISVFISVVLGLLIVYANRFLIRRRKKELGVYMLLGMNKGRINSILMLETFFIGLFSLVVGLILGVFVSQGFSILTAKMFQVNMKAFTFTFSTAAFWKTLVYFGVIFLVVMLFNLLTVSRVKLIDLLTAAKKNEVLHVRSLWVSVLGFLLSAGFLITAYIRIERDGITMLDNDFLFTIILGCIGTLLFFFSLSGFLLRLTQSNKKLYFKNLNMFVLRQVNSRVNTAFVSMSVICLLLFFAVCIFSGGFSMASALSGDTSQMTPFDASITGSVRGAKDPVEKVDLLDLLAKNGIDLSQYSQDYAQVYEYDTRVELADYINGVSAQGKPELPPYGMTFNAVSLSDYNQTQALRGKNPLSLKGDQYAMLCSSSAGLERIHWALKNNAALSLNGKTLLPAEGTAREENLRVDTGGSNMYLLVLPDEALAELLPYRTTINMQYVKGVDANAQDDKISLEVVSTLVNLVGDKPLRCSFATKQDVLDNSVGSQAMVSYIAIYIGIVFLLASAAVLALQQLSEASDNVERYGLLRKLGAEGGMINRALLAQVAIYFFLPLCLAIVHSAVGLHVIQKAVNMVTSVSVMDNLVLTVVMLVVIYGGYFLATYLGARAMIRQKKS